MRFSRMAAQVAAVCAACGCIFAAPVGALASSCTWSTQLSPNVGASNNALLRVAAVNASDAVAVGVYTQTTGVLHGLVLTYGGSPATWKNLPATTPGVGSAFTDVSPYSSSGAYISGAYKTSSGSVLNLLGKVSGSTFTAVKPPNLGATQNALTGVLSISATEAIVVGYFIDSLGYYQNYAELMNGGQFKNLNPPGQGGQYAGTNSEFTAISRVPGTADIDVSGYRDCPIDNLCPFVYRLNTTTGVWRLTTGKTPTTAGARFNAVDGISSGLTWAVGNSTVNSTTQAALIEKFNDATLGYTIEKLPLLPTNSGLADVAAESATNALAVGVSGPSNNQRPVALYWNGTAWSVASPATTLVSALFGVADIPGTNVYVDVGSKIVSGIGKTLIMKSTCD